MSDEHNTPSPEQMASTAQRYSHLRGIDPHKLATIPKRGSSPEAYRDTLQRLGAPADASGYADALKKVDGLPPEMVDWGAKAAAKASLFPHQAQHIAENFAKASAAGGAAAIEQEKREAEAEMESLKTDWAGDYVKNMEMSRRALRYAETRGHNAREVLNYLEAAIGPAAAIKALSFLGSRTMEGEFVEGDTGHAQPQSVLQRMYPNDY